MGPANRTPARGPCRSAPRVEQDEASFWLATELDPLALALPVQRAQVAVPVIELFLRPEAP